MKSSYGWMKASLITTTVLFQRIYQLHTDVIVKQTIYDLYTTLTMLGPKLCGKNIVSMQCEVQNLIYIDI